MEAPKAPREVGCGEGVSPSPPGSGSGLHAAAKYLFVYVAHWHSARCSLKRLSAGPGFNPQTRQNKLFQDYWRACFEINFSDRQAGLTVSSIICDR